MINTEVAIATILEQLSGATVTVFGDYCLDAYWDIFEGSPEVSVETGLPVRRVVSQRYSLGGAGSVVANLTELGVGKVFPIGVAGADMFGQNICGLLAATGADTSGFVTAVEWETMVYAKPFYGTREDSRIDFGTFNKLDRESLQLLLHNLERAVKQSDAVVLNQQVPGGLSSSITIQSLHEIIAAHPGVVFLADSRHYPERYRGAALKLNVSEAARFLDEDYDPETTEVCSSEMAMRISKQTGKVCFLTRGEHGIIVASHEEVTIIPGLEVIEATDSVGAGDAVTAALAAALAVGAPVVDAAILANAAAMITVKKLRTTGTASAAEVLAAAPELNYVFRPELADSPRNAKYISESGIEVVTKLPTNLGIKHCIFDHDGTISTLREGWERIMEPMMLRAILGGEYEIVDQAVFRQVRESVRGFIDRTTGVQTLVQMKGLAELVRQFGFVPTSEILDEHGYKEIFNIELMEMVKSRVEKLARGELDTRDFEIKNATLLLKELHESGAKLYLASGTDQADVIAEAEAMGYAHFFEGRIFGAVGNIHIEAKKIVLEKIIRENNLEGHEFATLGDGPVELRETKRRGGLCIGVASDEVRRFGLNLSKRRRLIRAGADLIVPDYSQLTTLLTALHVERSVASTY
jgi:rfaE bifunctional protein kinase chain/domain